VAQDPAGNPQARQGQEHRAYRWHHRHHHGHWPRHAWPGMATGLPQPCCGTVQETVCWNWLFDIYSISCCICSAPCLRRPQCWASAPLAAEMITVAIVSISKMWSPFLVTGGTDLAQQAGSCVRFGLLLIVTVV
jgi:hypothetical protein